MRFEILENFKNISAVNCLNITEVIKMQMFSTHFLSENQKQDRERLPIQCALKLHTCLALPL